MAAVLDAFTPYVKNLITDMAQQEVCMLLGVSAEIAKLEDNTEGLKAFLADAERRRITDRSVQRWVTKLKNDMYDATDIIDLCQLEADKRRESRSGGREQKAPSCLQPLLFCLRNPLFAHKIGSRIKELTHRLEGIHKEANNYRFNIGLGSNMELRMLTAAERYSQRMTSELNDSSIVGKKIEMDTKELAQSLMTHDNHYDIKVLSIVGTGGMGKTTLAQKIFNDTTIQHHFRLKIWLSITQHFNELDLLRTAIEHAGGVYGGVQDKTLLMRILTSTLSTGRFLLVLDDIWSDEAWSHVLCVPINNASQKQQGNWVIITTRLGDMAQRIGASFYLHHVSPLDEEDAWSLLNKQLPRSPSQVDGNGHLKDVGMKIIQKCGGLPLAIKVMGGLLSTRSRTEGEWQAVLNHRAWSVDGLPKELDNCMYLSYEDLSPQLKQCFLYCSLFPKGTCVRWRDVIPMWISEGFVQPQDGTLYNDQLEEIANEYYHELIMRNLIEPTEGNYISQYACTMHDVVRSFAEFIAREDMLVLQDQHVASRSKGSLVHLMSVGPTKLVPEWTNLQKQEMLRTLIIKCKVNFKPGDSLTSFSRLRVLSIDGGDCDMLVGSLCQLRHLRYLWLENTNISRLPENIHTMKFLQHISIDGSSNMQNLPGSIVKMVQLRTFFMKNLNVNFVIPKGFGGLTNLRALSGFPVHMNKDGDESWCSLEEIGSLSHIRGLTLHNLQNAATSSFAEMATISSKEQLEYLGLHWSSSGCMGVRDEIEKQRQQQVVEEVMEKLFPPFNIQHLHIEDYFGHQLPNWMVVPATLAFKSLRLLRLQNLPYCTHLPDGLCWLPSLEALDIVDAPAIKSIGSKFQACCSLGLVVAFPNLRHLVLEGLSACEEWKWEGHGVDESAESMAMPALKFLRIDNCKLSSLPPGLSSSKRLALRVLRLYKLCNMTSVENFPSVVELDVFDCPKLTRISGLSMLQKIRIIRCPNVEVLEYLTTVTPRYLQLTCSKKLYESLLTGTSSENDKISHIKSVDYFPEDED